jgi:hypothetical protein
MRATLTLISLFTLTSTGALAQWDVRPAPPSWGLPQTSGPAPAPAQSAQQTNGQTRIQAVTQTTSAMPASLNPAILNDAITCSAALQLATMAAPNWAQEKGITNITNAWLQKVFALGEPQGVSGDKVPGLVETEMQRQVEGAASDPAILSRRAFDCASRQP